MKIECILKRQGGTHVDMGGVVYHFAPQPDGAHVADIEDNAHIQRFLGIPEGYRIYVEPQAEDDHERQALVEEYEKKFGRKPHHKASADTIRKQLAE